MTNIGKFINTLVTFFSNPIIGIVASITSIVCLPLSIYFYSAVKENRELTFYIHPVKTVLVKAHESSRLTIKFDNKDLNTDISTAQIAVWNNGKKSIKRGDVLRPLEIKIENNIPILDAQVIKTSRNNISNINLDKRHLKQGYVIVNWDILEQNDGGVLQLIYAGKPELNIYADGVIEGQNGINQIKLFKLIKSPSQQYNDIFTDRRSVGFMFIIMGGGFLTFIYFEKKKGRLLNDIKFCDIVTILLLAVITLLGLYSVLAPKSGLPPFDF